MIDYIDCTLNDSLKQGDIMYDTKTGTSNIEVGGSKKSIDKVTAHYRKRQIERAQHSETVYHPTIKIANGCNSTNYLDISFDELRAIKALLTGK